MKQLIMFIAVIGAMIAFFVIIDRKDFYSGDDVAVQKEAVTRNPNTVATIKPIEKPVETKPTTETKPEVDTKSAEKKTVAETKLTMVKHDETKTKNGKEKLLPAAVPVVTAEEAKNLNMDALVVFEKTKKILVKEEERKQRGFSLVYKEDFKELTPISLSKSNAELLTKNNYNLEDFSINKIPKLWTIDYSTIPLNVSFLPTDDGFLVSSNQGALRIVGQRFNCMRSSFIFEITVINKSDKESEVALGINNSGLVKRGNTILVTEIIPGNEEKTIETEVNVYDAFANVSPTLTVKGDILLENLKMYRKDYENFTVVEGYITQRSMLPDPQETDYPNCRYTAHFVGNAIISGKPCNKELSLAIDGFKDKTILPTNSLRAGDKIRCAIVPIDSIPIELASIEESDDLSLFQLESYLLVSCEKITSFTDKLRNDFLAFKDTEYVSVFDLKINPRIDEIIKQKQKEAIEKEKTKIKKMLLNYSEEKKQDINRLFTEAWIEEQKKDPPGYNRPQGYVWRNVMELFLHAQVNIN